MANSSGCVKAPLPTELNGTYGSVDPVLEKYETGLLMVVGFGGISLLLAVIHRAVRKYVFHDQNNVDTAFDAGGRVSTSLTAVTVASQFLWPGDLLQSSTITVKSGISGPLFYTVGAAINIAMFPIVSVYLKTRAPGAKTFLQIMYARYGTPAHVVFCILALLVNLCVISTLLVAGVDTIQAFTSDASDEFAILIIAILFGSYSFVGGLGTTFYVSYFNAVLIFSILIALNVEILYSPNNSNGVGSFEKIYDKLDCLLAPEGNQDRSYLTFRSETGLVWAFMGLCVTASLTYCDQAAWQSRIAAKPVQGVVGFLIAAFIWFAIPVSISTTTGLAYLATASQNTSNMLSPQDIDMGQVTPFMAQRLLGNTGGILILTLIAMTLMSTGSGEVMAVSSIIVYDIYQTYISPFRKGHKQNKCILCDQMKENSSTNGLMKHQDPSLCQCPYVSVCVGCREDEVRNQTGKTHSRRYDCKFHGEFRHYRDKLYRYKSWCILWVTIGIVPLGMAVKASGIDLNWAMLFGFIITLPCFPPVVLSTFWSRTSGPGVIAGALFGTVCGVSVALGVASTFEGGLNNFMKNTVENLSVISGAGTSIGVSFFTTLLVSCATHKIRSEADVSREWDKMRNIDNPLHPWAQIYEEDIPNLKAGERPSQESLNKVFSKARIIALSGGFLTLVLFVGIVPATMISLNVLSLPQFETWTHTLQIFCFLMAAVVVIVAPVEEIVQVLSTRAKNKLLKRGETLEKHAYAMPLEDS